MLFLQKNEEAEAPPSITNVLMVEVENLLHDKYETTEEVKVSPQSEVFFSGTTCHLLTMKRQWTYGPALLPWFDHFHTSLACFTAL